MSFWTYPDDRYYYRWYENLPPPDVAPSDGDIKAMIVDRLREDPHTSPYDLRVDVKRGVVILSGEVPSRLAKRAAGDDCWDTPGVVDVSNQLEVAADTEGGTEGTVADVMARDVVVVAPDESVAVAAERMRDADVGSLPVVDADRRLLGIITDRDIVLRCVAKGVEPTAVLAGDVCTTDVTPVAPTDTLSQVVEVMRNSAIRRVPVVDEGSRLVGIVSLGDLARTRDPGSALADISAAPPDREP